MSGRARRTAVVLGMVVAALLALRAAAVLVAPPADDGAVPATGPAATVPAATGPAAPAGTSGASLLLGAEDGLFRLFVRSRERLRDEHSRVGQGANPPGDRERVRERRAGNHHSTAARRWTPPCRGRSTGRAHGWGEASVAPGLSDRSGRRRAGPSS